MTFFITHPLSFAVARTVSKAILGEFGNNALKRTSVACLRAGKHAVVSADRSPPMRHSCARQCRISGIHHSDGFRLKIFDDERPSHVNLKFAT